MSDWENHADAAAVDITAARLTEDKGEAYTHLRDALVNVQRAIAAIETDEDEEGGRLP